uniref:Uncharacterized protein n=1 Tax=Rhizophora mucronata TaxID=61149 RepID=A0A2P2IKF6_RHIMU
MGDGPCGQIWRIFLCLEQIRLRKSKQSRGNKIWSNKEVSLIFLLLSQLP